MATVHIVGAGLAGLACAVSLASRRHRIVLHEAAGQAGGRCRSLDDRELGCRIDNGNHFLLSANRAALSYLDRIGARAELSGPVAAEFPFVDLATGERWILRPNPGPIPWWLLVAGTPRPRHHAPALSPGSRRRQRPPTPPSSSRSPRPVPCGSASGTRWRRPC